jgi:DNA (cytosine-5)-methyltransferase 1
VNKKDIPKHSVLVGGFPCQDYSVARPLAGANGIEGKKGVLWWQIYETIKAKSPPFVLLENVDRLLKSPASQRGRDFGVMLACFSELGYNAEWRVVNAADYGGAQRRRRVFVFAWKRKTKYEKTKNGNAGAQLKGKGFFATAFPVESLSKENEISIRGLDVYEMSDAFEFEFGNCGYLRDGAITTVSAVPKTEKFVPLARILEKNVDEKYYLNGNIDKWSYLKGGKREKRKHKNGHEYFYCEGAINFPDSLDMPGRTMLTSEATVNRSTHVVEDPETGKLRLITPVEAERLQGFEDNWTNTGMPERARYFCMGNALVVPMVERIVKALEKIVEAE